MRWDGKLGRAARKRSRASEREKVRQVGVEEKDESGGTMTEERKCGGAGKDEVGAVRQGGVRPPSLKAGERRREADGMGWHCTDGMAECREQ